jgi:hypothetical protein
VVEKNRVEASAGEVLVRVNVVVVRHGHESVCGLGGAKRVVRDRTGESPDLAAPEVGERAEPARLGGAYGEHLAKLEVRHRHRDRGAAGRRVLHARQSDVEIAALDGLVDRLVGHLYEPRRSSEAPRERPGYLHVEAAHVCGIRRVRLDERRAALRVAAPAQHERIRSRRARRARRQHHPHDDGSDHFRKLPSRSATIVSTEHPETRSPGR